MKLSLSATRIRTRLLIAYLGIVFVGFAALTLVAGQEISSAARADYEQRLQNEIRLIAQGIRPYFESGSQSEAALNEVLTGYETQIGGTLTVLGLDENGPPSEHSLPHDMPEVEAAQRNGVVIVERADDNGTDMLYTAASVLPGTDPRRPVIVQLGVPLDNLQTLVWQRWASLGLVFALVTAMALLAALALSQSIIRPLYALRDSAVQLARGDFSHRVAYSQPNEIGEVARAFNEMARQVESMLEEQRAFASNTSHELRTPLTTIRLRSEALREDKGLDAETAARYIGEIDDEVNRMSGLIEDLTLLSRFDAGRAELGDNQIDLGRFAANLQQHMLAHAEARHIRLTLTSPRDILPVRASLNHLTVVFRNLLDNAIKYTPDGGEISWSITAGADGFHNVIKDNGQGIEPDQRPHLFERFYRTDKAHSRDIPGTGLGLAIVKSIVEAYGGSISVESEGVGKGTSVTVIWPAFQ